MSLSHLNLKRSATVNPMFSWLDWDLYEVDEAETVAKALNYEIRSCVNDLGCDRILTRESVERVMREHAAAGANDSGAHRLLNAILDEIFVD